MSEKNYDVTLVTLVVTNCIFSVIGVFIVTIVRMKIKMKLDFSRNLIIAIFLLNVIGNFQSLNHNVAKSIGYIFIYYNVIDGNYY